MGQGRSRAGSYGVRVVMALARDVWSGLRKKTNWLLCGFVAVLILVLSVWLVWEWLPRMWDWLGRVPERKESNSTTIRNMGLLIGGFIAIPLAVWRSIVAHRQAQTAQRGLRNERYQKGAEMLSSEFLPVRLGGIFALQRLAEEDPEQYHVQIMRLLCAFVRRPTGHKSVGVFEIRSLLEDIRAIVEIIRTRSEVNITLEKEKNLLGLELEGARLPHSYFREADLSGSHFFSADLSGAVFMNANLTGAYLYGADLSDADLSGANLSGANLADANLSGTSFHVGVHPAKGLTQTQLNQARADASKPPDLNYCFDAETGKPLEWIEKSPETEVQGRGAE